MAFRRVMDVRVRYRQTGEVDLYIDGLLWGDPITLPAPRVGAILAAFNTGHRCYWDSTGKVFTTDPTMPANPVAEGPTVEGEVSSWEVRIPRSGPMFIVLNLLPDLPPGANPPDQTSGEPVMGSAVLEVPDDAVIGAMVPLLDSNYLRFEGGHLRNSDFEDWI